MGGFVKFKGRQVSYELPEYVPEWHKGEGADVWAYASAPAPEAAPEAAPAPALTPVEAARERWWNAVSADRSRCFAEYQQALRQQKEAQ